ncbi:hypothetical protein VIGAN_UM148700 [Vigna angularis var. angularis]|uniref:Uncharacterized protein n=1 Tax=Vigna angularis var. angularis TaxID=157739 RepID=A0A0S3TEH6_PHAAN|nr:hypothetical protein VIGAN_UM090400 [Vigna angularis var. angularis]BAU03645.1 hypothetical protein VIGAN_UM148700 [Vigna angularis var. angularis]
MLSNECQPNISGYVSSFKTCSAQHPLNNLNNVSNYFNIIILLFSFLSSLHSRSGSPLLLSFVRFSSSAPSPPSLH